MTARQLLVEVGRRGIRLEARAGRLRFEAPRGTMTPELRDALQQHRHAVLDVLSTAPETLNFIPLKGGLVVPEPALHLALDLEIRGIPLRTDTDHQFIVPSDPRLTEADLAAIARWRHHLGALVEYRAPEVG
jgi:hypothetical protein